MVLLQCLFYRWHEQGTERLRNLVGHTVRKGESRGLGLRQCGPRGQSFTTVLFFSTRMFIFQAAAAILATL